MRELCRTRVVLVGTGAVGASYAFSLMQDGSVDELVLLDVNVAKAEGDVMDLNHGLSFASPMRIWQGDYSDCGDADVVVITAGASQKPGESRLDLLQRNAAIMDGIVRNVLDSGFDGIFVVASNPVDVLSYVTWRVTGLDPGRVIGSGTMLDTARFRYLLGEYFEVDPRNVHAYIIGEHGNTELPVWSHADIGGTLVTRMVKDSPDRYSMSDLEDIFVNVRDAAHLIIERKGATYYAIAMALVRLTKAIIRNENSILTVSTLLRGDYGLDDLYIGVPAVVNREGVREVTCLDLTDEETAGLHHSARTLKEAMAPLLTGAAR